MYKSATSHYRCLRGVIVCVCHEWQNSYESWAASGHRSGHQVSWWAWPAWCVEQTARRGFRSADRFVYLQLIVIVSCALASFLVFLSYGSSRNIFVHPRWSCIDIVSGYCMSVADADALLSPSMLCFIFFLFLFHFPTKIFACLSSLKPSSIELNFNTMCRMVSVRGLLFLIIFSGNPIYLLAVLGCKTCLDGNQHALAASTF